MSGTDILFWRIEKRTIENLHPAYFAMVMSTGIVSIAFDGLGMRWIAESLFVLNIVTYLTLLTLFASRIAIYRGAFLADLRHPTRSWGFLTFVVGTNTLGSQFILFHDLTTIASVLWGMGILSWVFFVYVIYLTHFRSSHEHVEDAIDGSTLLTTVSTQSVAVLGALLAGTFGGYADIVLFTAWGFWAAGFILYLLVITLVTYRLLFRPFEAEDWTGPYWICMGAVAITTLAGANLVLRMESGVGWEEWATSTLVVTFLAWAIGTWWIPIQLSMDIWKFRNLDLGRSVPRWITIFPWARLGFGQANHFYEPPAWGRVFPMGMYTACSIALWRATGLEFLYFIPATWGWFALIVWLLTFIGTLRSVTRAIHIGTSQRVSAHD